MADLLDIRTLLVTVIVTYGICSCAIAFLRWKIPSIPGLGHFLAGTLTTIPALSIYLMDPAPASVLSSIVGNYLSVLSVALHLEGVLRFYDRPPRLPIWLLPIALIPLFYFWTFVTPSTELRVLAVIVPMAVICLTIAWQAIAHSRGAERTLSWLIALGFGIFGLAFVGRIAGMSWNPWAAIMDAGAPSTAMTFLLSNIAMISGTLGLVLVATQRLVQELLESRAAAEAGSRAKSEFLAVMSHEIRTPMNGVLGAASLILGTPTDERIKRYAETIETSGRAMLRIVDDVLDFSKIEAGGLELESIPFDLTAEIASTAGAFREAAALKGLTLDLDIDAGSPTETSPPRVLGDPGRLRQVLSNLVSNAIKFTEQGGVEIRLIMDQSVSPEQLGALVEVCDTGLGISPELRERLFHPFKQADASTTRRFGGTGLGLAISRDLVEQMGGTIGVRERSTPGLQGSTFWFAIPFPVVDVDQEPVASSDHIRLQEIRRRAARILVAEDNPINQFVITEMLEELGYEVVVVDDGRQALDTVQGSPFDMVLMDCRMPEMDGFESTRRIRSLEAMDDLSIVAITATAFEDDHRQCLEAGMNAILTKPVIAKELHRVLKEWLPADRG